jgi:hypothetical protein
MKKLALVIAFALLASVSVSAAEISQAAPVTPAASALEQQVQGTPPLFFEANFRPPVPRCYTVDGTSCPAAGATTPCTDVCNNALSCTCYNTYAPPYYIIVTGHYWRCLQEC